MKVQAIKTNIAKGALLNPRLSLDLRSRTSSYYSLLLIYIEKGLLILL